MVLISPRLLLLKFGKTVPIFSNQMDILFMPVICPLLFKVLYLAIAVKTTV